MFSERNNYLRFLLLFSLAVLILTNCSTENSSTSSDRNRYGQTSRDNRTAREIREEEIEEKKAELIDEYSERGKGYILSDNSICVIDFPDRIEEFVHGRNKTENSYSMGYIYDQPPERYQVHFKYEENYLEDTDIETIVKIYADNDASFFNRRYYNILYGEENLREGGYRIELVYGDDINLVGFDGTITGVPIGEDQVGILIVHVFSFGVSSHFHAWYYKSWDFESDCEIIDLSLD